MDIIELTRILNIILTVIATGTWIYFYIKTKNLVAIAPLSWLFSLLAFYIVRLSTLSFSSAIKNTDFLNLWSSLLHTHAILLTILVAWMVLDKLNNKKNCIPNLEKKLKDIQKNGGFSVYT